MKQDKNEDARAQGGIPLDMIQRGINQWYALSADLFGSEISSNAASYFASGVKGRAYEMKKYDEHLAMDSALTIQTVKDGKLVNEEVPMRNALNEVLREEFRDDDERAVARWNKILKKEGIDYEFKLPDRKFYRTSRGVCRPPFRHARKNDRRSDLGTKERRLAARPRRPRLYAIHSGPSHRTRQIRKLDCAAQKRNQRPTSRLRVRSYLDFLKVVRAAPL